MILKIKTIAYIIKQTPHSLLFLGYLPIIPINSRQSYPTQQSSTLFTKIFYPNWNKKTLPLHKSLNLNDWIHNQITDIPTINIRYHPLRQFHYRNHFKSNNQKIVEICLSPIHQIIKNRTKSFTTTLTHYYAQQISSPFKRLSPHEKLSIQLI